MHCVAGWGHDFRLEQPAEIVGGFDRPNLRLTVLRFQQDTDKRRGVVERVLDERGLGLVFVATRKDTAAYADELARHNVTAQPYTTVCAPPTAAACSSG